MSSKLRVVVLRIVAGQLSVTAAAEEYGISRRQLHRLLARYREEGIDGLEPRSRAPLTSPQAVTERVRDRIIALRRALTAVGTDAGPVTIAWHVQQEGLRAPSKSTIRRILHTAGLITPEPRKRPRSSYVRFEASQPNETWQSDGRTEPRNHTRHLLRSDPESVSSRPLRPHPLPSPTRPRRHQRQDQLPPLRPHAPPRRRREPPQRARAPTRRRTHRHRRRHPNRRNHRHQPDPARKNLLAQHVESPRPMARGSQQVTHDATQMRPMSRLNTWWT